VGKVSGVADKGHGTGTQGQAHANNGQSETSAPAVEATNPDKEACKCYYCKNTPGKSTEGKGFSFWRLISSNAIIAMAAIVTAWYAGVQYEFGKQTQTAVIVPNFVINEVSNGSLRYWTVAPHISNQGNETSGNVMAVMGNMYRDNTLAQRIPNFSDASINPDMSEVSFDESNNVVILRPGLTGRPRISPPHNFVSIGGIGPKQDIQMGIIAIPEEEVKLLKSGAETLFLLGRVNYQDTFNHARWHVAKFCYRVYGDASDTQNFARWGERLVQTYDPGDLQLTYRLCSHNNCSDSQCESQQ
jgi:hypothetical protein